jgi:hypothetical protein
VANVEVNQHIYNLSKDPKIRSDVRRIVSPLVSDGFDIFEARDGDNVVTRVTHDEVSNFDPWDDEPNLLLDNETEAILEVIKPSFQLGNKWTVTDGRSNFYVEMNDEAFIARVQNRDLAFKRGDTLKVRLATRTWREDDALKSRHTVVKVLEFLPSKPPVQSRLFD